MPSNIMPDYCQHEDVRSPLLTYDPKEVRLQVLPTKDRLSYARCKVEVQQRLDGSLAVYYQGQALPTELAPLEPAVLRKIRLKEGAAAPSLSARRHTKPAPDHPWRGIYRKQLQNAEI